MRSLLDINTELSELISQKGGYESKRAESKARKRVEFLNLAKRYIESNPDEYFMTKEIFRIENRIHLLRNSFNEVDYKDPKEARKKYEKDMGIPELQQQLKALRFIKN